MDSQSFKRQTYTRGASLRSARSWRIHQLLQVLFHPIKERTITPGLEHIVQHLL